MTKTIIVAYTNYANVELRQVAIQLICKIIKIKTSVNTKIDTVFKIRRP